MDTTFITVLYKDGENITREQTVEVLDINDFILGTTIEQNKLTLGTTTINAYCNDPVVKRVIQDNRIHFVRDFKSADIVIMPKTKQYNLPIPVNSYVYVSTIGKYIMNNKADSKYMSNIDMSRLRKIYNLSCKNEDMRAGFFVTRDTIRSTKIFNAIELGFVNIFMADHVYNLLFQDKPSPTLDDVKSMYEMILTGNDKMFSKLIDNYNMCDSKNIWATKVLCMRIRNTLRNKDGKRLCVPDKIHDMLAFGSHFSSFNDKNDIDELSKFEYVRKHLMEIKNFLGF